MHQICQRNNQLSKSGDVNPLAPRSNRCIRYATRLKHFTVPKEKLNNRVIPYPGEQIAGGSSALDVMYLLSSSCEELDTWKHIIAAEGDTTAAIWGWDNMFTNMKETDNFTAPNTSI
ncbi:hypothetical protein BJ165DRAFT_1615440 [Panaeolus papilionaceus]|nr:hypothetical protein BJ165DRAFT_1615440 [Panaeolus papilionaceus]